MSHDKIFFTAAEFFEQIYALPSVDAHEHLLPEPLRITHQVDAFTFFTGYSELDLTNAGMPVDMRAQVFGSGLSPTIKWRLFAPWYERIRHTGFTAAARIAMRKFCGAEDFSEDTVADISAAIQADNTPGLYDRVFDACNIRAVLNQNGRTASDNSKIFSVMPLPFFSETRQIKASFVCPFIDSGAFRARPESPYPELVWPAFPANTTIETLDDFTAAVLQYMRSAKKAGAIGFKIDAKTYNPVSRDDASDAFSALMDGRVKELPNINPVKNYILDLCFTEAAALGLPVAVHAGYWGDFRNLNPSNLVPAVMKHPDTRFDLYHLGYPYIHEALMMGKAYPNVFINFCWAHILSPQMAQTALDIALELLPINKIIAFGGDYALPVENIYGHLTLARQNVAAVLARRVCDGRMRASSALDAAKMLFYDNAAELYNIL